MTPAAICRPWFRHFWVVGRLEAFTAFGSLPLPVAVSLPASARAALRGAVEQGELRIALVGYRRHALSDLLASTAAPGCFAVSGLRAPAPCDAAEHLIDTLFQQRIHIALLPEIALDPGELGLFKQLLNARRRRFPVLVVAGLVHRCAPSGASHINEAVMLSAHGDEVMRYEKLEPFTDEKLGMEDILPRQSELYPFIDSPVGRIVVNICRDVRSDIPSLLNRALGATLLLVPSYSNRLDFALEEARVLGQRQMAVTAVANPLAEGLRDFGAIYAPVRGKLGCLVAREAVETDPRVCGKHTAILVFRLRLDGRHGTLDACACCAV